MLTLAARRKLAAEIVRWPDGVYRDFLGELRRQKRSLRLGKPVKKVASRRIRRDTRDMRWSEAIRERDPVCRAWAFHSTSKHPSQEAAHVMPRRFLATRWLLENGLGLCRSQHQFYTDHPQEFEFACRQILGDVEYDRLWRLAHHVKGQSDDG